MAIPERWRMGIDPRGNRPNLNAMRMHPRITSPLAAVFSIALFGAATTPAQANEPTKAELSYEVFTFGGLVLSLDANIDVDQTSFRARTRSQTRGFIDLIIPFTSEVETLGLVKTSGQILNLHPERHDAHTVGRFAAKRSVIMTWDDKRMPQAEVKPPANDDDRDPVPPEKTLGTIDPLSAAIGRALLAPRAEPCAGTDQIFDGRRRYNLHYMPLGAERLEPFKLAAYAGDTVKCRIKFERIAGYMKQYEERNRKADEAENILWLARDDASRFWFPVRLQSEGFFGPVNGYLVRAVVNGQTRMERRESTGSN